METTWTKNKFTLISMCIYLLTTLAIGNLSGIKPIILAVFTLTIPLVFNWRIQYTKGFKSFISLIIAGAIFGIYITPFGFSTVYGDIYNNISYWVLLLQFNIFYALHRGSYRTRVDRLNLSDERDIKIDEILNPVKKRFFQ
jgi:hypothetical protein